MIASALPRVASRNLTQGQPSTRGVHQSRRLPGREGRCRIALGGRSGKLGQMGANPDVRARRLRACDRVGCRSSCRFARSSASSGTGPRPAQPAFDRLKRYDRQLSQPWRTMAAMAASGDRSGTPLARLRAALDDLRDWLSSIDEASLGEPLIEIRAVIDRSESVFAEGVRRFDKSGEYKADCALSVTEWLRGRCKLSGGAAAERVEVARQLENLPKTEAAFANGQLGYQHVVAMARAAEHVGAAAVRQEEGNLPQGDQALDPGEFTHLAN